MKGGHKAFRYLGHRLTKLEYRAVISFIAMVHLPIGIPKKKIENEAHFWEVVEKAFGCKPFAGDPFMVSVRRIAHEIRSIPSSKRTEMRNKAYPGMGAIPGIQKPGGVPLDGPTRKARNRTKKKDKRRYAPSPDVKETFYRSWEWRTLRMEVLKEFGRACQCCGALPGQETVSGAPVRIVVDHIKPISKFWSLRLDRTNLQVLCDECNQGKGAWDQSDYRPDGVEDALTAEYRAIMSDDNIVHFPAQPERASA